MKKLFTLLLISLVWNLSAQTIFVERTYNVGSQDWNSFLELYDSFYGDVNFKSGGLVIDWIRIGEGDYTIRTVRYGDMNNWGMTEERPEYEGPNFWSRRNQYINDFGPSYAGKSLYRQGDGSKHNTQQRWYMKVSDPQKFFIAFQDFLKANKEAFGDRWISLVQYTVGGPDGATHSVGMSAESWIEMEQTRDAIFKNEKTVNDFFINRGPVEEIYNVIHRRMRHYNNTRNKNKTFGDMW